MSFITSSENETIGEDRGLKDNGKIETLQSQRLLNKPTRIFNSAYDLNEITATRDISVFQYDTLVPGQIVACSSTFSRLKKKRIF